MTKESFATIQSKAAEIKAYMDQNPQDAMTMDHYEYLMSEFSYLERQISSIWDAIYKRDETSLPPILGPDKMKKALKVLGLDGDYEVKPRVIYASDGSKQKAIFEILY